MTSKTAFSYDPKMTLAGNYISFQQAITFERGVEFLLDAENSSAVIYLVSIPGLPLELDAIKTKLSELNSSLIGHLNIIIGNEKNLYKLYSSFIDLYRAVKYQHKEFTLGTNKYFGRAIVKEFPNKLIKELQIPIVRSNYRGLIVEHFGFVEGSITFDELGSEIKEYLKQIYLRRRKANIQLLKSLEHIKDWLFNKNSKNKFTYSGDKSELVELGIALFNTHNIKSLNSTNSNNSNLVQFLEIFCHFFGIEYLKLGNYTHTIQKRKAQNQSYLKKLDKILGQFLDNYEGN